MWCMYVCECTHQHLHISHPSCVAFRVNRKMQTCIFSVLSGRFKLGQVSEGAIMKPYFEIIPMIENGQAWAFYLCYASTFLHSGFEASDGKKLNKKYNPFTLLNILIFTIISRIFCHFHCDAFIVYHSQIDLAAFHFPVATYENGHSNVIKV